MASSSSQEPRNVLPGFGLPLVNLPQWHPWRVEDERKRERLPHAISDHVASKGVTLRERRMLEFIGQISDKPEWDRKVFDESIVVKWKEEAYRFVEELDDKFLSEKMFDFVRQWV